MYEPWESLLWTAAWAVLRCIQPEQLLSMTVHLQVLPPAWTNATCWSTISMTSRIFCRFTSCPQASWSGTFRSRSARCVVWAARRNTPSSSTSSPPSPHQVDGAWIYCVSDRFSMSGIKSFFYLPWRIVFFALNLEVTALAMGLAFKLIPFL